MTPTDRLLRVGAFGALLAGCAPNEPGIVPPVADAPAPLDDEAATPDGDRVVPLFALIPTAPDAARMLWVPWSRDAVVYRVERRPSGGGHWAAHPAKVDTDAAFVLDLQPGDELRVAAFEPTGERLGQSVALAFTPATQAPEAPLGRQVSDGRGQPWKATEDAVTGTGPMPSVGSLLLLPVRLEGPSGEVREVVSVVPLPSGWRAETRPFEVPAPPRLGSLGSPAAAPVTAGISLNMSVDGLPRGALQIGPDGRVGYCSASGWGCIEFDATDVEPRETPSSTLRGATDWYDWSQTLDLDPVIAKDGLTVGASAQGGVRVQLEYETAGLFVPTIQRVAARATPYAYGEISATLATTSTRVTIERSLYTSPRIVVWTATFASVAADFDLAMVLDLVAEAPVQGRWHGEIGYSRTFEVGYYGQFYGPKVVDEEPLLLLTPEFGDGSKADLWAGWRARAALHLNILGFDVLTGTLTPTAGLVFVHESTKGAPCGKAISIAHAEVDLGAKLEADLDFPFTFLDRDFLLADKRTPILVWGHPRAVSAARIPDGSSPVEFRLRPGPATAASESVLVWGDVDVTDPAELEVWLDGSLRSATMAVEQGRYRLQASSPFAAGERSLALWLPDLDHSPTSVFGAPGQCTTTTLKVGGAG